jgi:hypothetical protein
MKWPWVWLLPLMLASLPASTNYQLNSYGFGTGGTADSNSADYHVNAIAGDAAHGKTASTHFGFWGGETHEKEANVPTITISNDDRWYNKLKVVIGPENNPSDALFAVAISTDNFVSDIKYVKNDFTVTSSLSFSDYLTYAAWGSGTGQIVRGLKSSTTYTVKAKAYRGKFTESPYGPTSAVSTDSPQLSFDIDVSAIDESTSPPYIMTFGTIFTGSVTDSNELVWESFDTNADTGGNVYVTGANAGLRSASAAYTIASVTADLSGASEGYGAQAQSATQTGDGPLTIASPYDGAGDNVGIIDGSQRVIFGSSGPVILGRGSFVLKSKTNVLTPESDDYGDLLTSIAAGDF